MRTLHSPTYSSWTLAESRWSPGVHPPFFLRWQPSQMLVQSPPGVQLPPGGGIWTQWTPPENTQLTRWTPDGLQMESVISIIIIRPEKKNAMSRIWTLQHMDKWAEIMHNKPLHHQGLNIYSKYTQHIPPILSTFSTVSKHCLLIFRIAMSPIFHPPTMSHHIPTASHHVPSLHTSFNLPTTPRMPAKLKKTAPADLRKCQASNADKQPVKWSRCRVQNDDKDEDNNQGDTATNQWADHEDQWEDQCTQEQGNVRHANWTGARTTPKQHTHTLNLNTLSPTIHARYFEFRVLKVLENTQMFYLVELTLLIVSRIFVYKNRKW